MEFVETENSHMRRDWPRESYVTSSSISKIELLEVNGLIQSFLNRGLNDSLMNIVNIESGHKFQFKKYIVGERQYGIIGLFQFPAGSDKLKVFQVYCVESGLTIVGQEGARSTEEYGVFRIDFEKRVQIAREALRYIAHEIEKLPESAKFNVELLGVSQWNEIISSPRQMPASKEVGLSLTRDWIRKNTGTGKYGNFAFIFLGLCQIVGVLSLIVALIVRSDGIFRFRLLQSGFVLDVPLWDAISLLLVFLGFFAVLSPAYWRIPTVDRVESTTPVPRKAGAMIRHFFSKPINWATLGILTCVAFTWISELQ